MIRLIRRWRSPTRRSTRLAIVVAASMIAFTTVPATLTAAAAAPASGNDISWPQCGRLYPVTPAFGIVGANGGRPFTDNPCLASQYRWAQAAGPPGLYMNTANPGPGSSGVDWYGQHSPNPGCSPANEAACGYNFGYAAAQHAYRYANAQVPAGPGHTWWLDVETSNSWSGNLGVNLADVAGSVAFLASQGVTVGIYSTRYQWGRITGGARFPTIPNWVAGAAGAAQAAAFCTPSRSFTGGPVVVAQYVTQGFDFDYPCPGSDSVLHPPQPPPPAPQGLGAIVSALLALLGLGPKTTGG